MTVTPAIMQAIAVHPGWGDGREGFVYCRLDVVLDQSGLRAELTWESDNDADDAVLRYKDPELMLETNTRIGDEWRTFDSIVIALGNDDAVRLMESDPRELLTSYATQIAALKRPQGTKT